MKHTSILLFVLIFLLQGCGPNEREERLKKRELASAQKEQQLLEWEQKLKLKEQELDHTQQSLDSAKKEIDSADAYNPAIVGKWMVKMICTETTCDGSALGDTKTELWDINYKGNQVVVNAYSGKVLVRVYEGGYSNNVLKITDEKVNADVSITALLNFVNEKRIEGKREIVQTGCKIVYALTVERAK